MKSKLIILSILTVTFFTLIGANCVGQGKDDVKDPKANTPEEKEPINKFGLIDIEKKLVPIYTLKTAMDELAVYKQTDYQNGGDPLWRIVATAGTTSNVFQVQSGLIPIFTHNTSTYHFDTIVLYLKSSYPNSTPLWSYQHQSDNCGEFTSNDCIKENVIYGGQSPDHPRSDSNTTVIPPATITNLDPTKTYVIYGKNTKTGLSGICEFKVNDVIEVVNNDNIPSFKLKPNHIRYCPDTSNETSTENLTLRSLSIYDADKNLIWEIIAKGQTYLPTNETIQYTHDNSNYSGKAYELSSTNSPALPTTISENSKFYIVGRGDNLVANSDHLIGLKSFITVDRPDDNVNFFVRPSGLTPHYIFNDSSKNVKYITLHVSSDYPNSSNLEDASWTITTSGTKLTSPIIHNFTSSGGVSQSGSLSGLVDGTAYRVVARDLNGYPVGHSFFTARANSNFFILRTFPGIRPTYSVNSLFDTDPSTSELDAPASYGRLKIFLESAYQSNPETAVPVFDICSGTSSSCNEKTNTIGLIYRQGDKPTDTFHAGTSVLTENMEYRAIGYGSDEGLIGYKVFTATLSNDYIDLSLINTFEPNFTIFDKVKKLSVYDNEKYPSSGLMWSVKKNGDDFFNSNEVIQYKSTPADSTLVVSSDLKYFGTYRVVAYDEDDIQIGYSTWVPTFGLTGIVTLGAGLTPTIDSFVQAYNLGIYQSGDTSPKYLISSTNFLPTRIIVGETTSAYNVIVPHSLDFGIQYILKLTKDASHNVSKEFVLTNNVQSLSLSTNSLATKIAHGVIPKAATENERSLDYTPLKVDERYVVVGFLNKQKIDAQEFSVFKTDSFSTIQVGTSESDYVYDLKIDDENIYIAGMTEGFFINTGNVVDALGEDGIIFKYNKNFIQEWRVQPRTDQADLIKSIEIDGDKLIAIGNSKGDFSDLSNSGLDDIFINVRNTSTGSSIKSLLYGSQEGHSDKVYGSDIDKVNDTVFLVGSSTVDSSTSSWGDTIGSGIINDPFILKVSIDYAATNDTKASKSLYSVINALGVNYKYNDAIAKDIVLGTDNKPFIVLDFITETGSSLFIRRGLIVKLKNDLSASLKTLEISTVNGSTAQDIEDMVVEVIDINSGDIHVVGSVTGSFKDRNNPDNKDDWFIYKTDENLADANNTVFQSELKGNDHVYDFVTDSDGFIYVTGYYEDSTELASSCQSGAGNSFKKHLLIAKINNSDTFAAKDGSIKWASYRSADDINISGSVCDDIGYTIEINENANRIYVSGISTGSIGNIGNFGKKDIFMMEFTLDGKQVLD